MLAGTGTAGAYHAGVLRALAEAGVRIDLVAGRGIGAVSALFAAVDAAGTLWEPSGIWTGRARPRLYPWRRLWTAGACCLVAAVGALAAPLAALLLLAVAWAPALVLDLVSPDTGVALTALITDAAIWITRSETATALVSRTVALAVLALALLLAGAFLLERRRTRRARGAPWWRALGAPLDAGPVVRWALDGFWSFVHGATPLPRPDAAELGRRYTELLRDNLSQPGYRELIIAAHDIETRRDLIFALLRDEVRSRFFGSDARDPRRAEVVDLAAAGGAHVMDAVAAALSVPLLTEPHVMTFAASSFWRGEAHRVCDRPAAIVRLLEEVSAAGAEQVIVVTADVAVDRPHALGPRLVAPRDRLADYLAGAEASAARDALTALFDRFSAVYQVQPTHNAVGLFAARGSYDERSDRRQSLRELIDLGYEDAHRQFIDPVVGASGDELEQREPPAKRPPVEPPPATPAGPASPSISEMLARLE